MGLFRCFYFAYSWQTAQIILDEPVSVCLRYFCFSGLMREIFHMEFLQKMKLGILDELITISSEVNDATDVFLSRCFMSSIWKCTSLTTERVCLSFLQFDIKHVMLLFLINLPVLLCFIYSPKPNVTHLCILRF